MANEKIEFNHELNIQNLIQPIGDYAKKHGIKIVLIGSMEKPDEFNASFNIAGGMKIGEIKERVIELCVETIDNL